MGHWEHKVGPKLDEFFFRDHSCTVIRDAKGTGDPIQEEKASLASFNSATSPNGPVNFSNLTPSNSSIIFKIA